MERVYRVVREMKKGASCVLLDPIIPIFFFLARVHKRHDRCCECERAPYGEGIEMSYSPSFIDKKPPSFFLLVVFVRVPLALRW